MPIRYRLACLALLLAAPAASHAQPTDEVAALRSEVAELRAEMAAMRAQLAARDDDDEPAAVAPAVPALPEQAPAAARDLAPAIPETRAANMVLVPLDQPGQRPGVQAAFQLTGSTSGKRAELLLSDTVSSTDFDGGSEGRGYFETLALTASAPLSDDGPTNIGTLDGLSDGFELKLRVTSHDAELRRPAPATIRAINQLATTTCLQREASAPDKAKLCNPEGGGDLAFLQRYLSAREFAAYQRSFFGDAALAWGLEASVGYKNYSFLDPATAAEGETDRMPFGVEMFAVWYPGGGRTALTGSMGYQRSYKAGTSAALCGVATPPATRCPIGAMGPPSERDKLLLSLGERSYFPLPDFVIPGIAIAPTVTYDAMGDDFGFDLPIYLVPDGDGNLLGGIRLGYETEEDEFGIGIFVGSTFSLGQ